MPTSNLLEAKPGIQKVTHFIKKGIMLHIYLSGVWLGVDKEQPPKRHHVFQRD